MIYELNDTTKAEKLFDGWEETLVYSCLQKVMGKIFVTDKKNPRSAMAFVGCFAFYAGEPDKELVTQKPAGFVIMRPHLFLLLEAKKNIWNSGEECSS